LSYAGAARPRPSPEGMIPSGLLDLEDIYSAIKERSPAKRSVWAGLLLRINQVLFCSAEANVSGHCPPRQHLQYGPGVLGVFCTITYRKAGPRGTRCQPFSVFRATFYPRMRDCKGMKFLCRGSEASSPGVLLVQPQRNRPDQSQGWPTRYAQPAFFCISRYIISPNAGLQRDEIPLPGVWGEQPRRNPSVPLLTNRKAGPRGTRCQPFSVFCAHIWDSQGTMSLELGSGDRVPSVPTSPAYPSACLCTGRRFVLQ